MKKITRALGILLLTALSFSCSDLFDEQVYTDYIEENSYKVTYNLNGGKWRSESMVNSFTRKGTESVVLPNLREVYNEEGLHFEGWYLDKKFTDGPYATVDKGDYSFLKDVTLYAKWSDRADCISLSLDQTFVFVNDLKGSIKLTPTAKFENDETPANYSIIWTSANSEIAKVVNGTVTFPGKTGTTTITCYVDDLTAFCVFVVPDTANNILDYDYGTEEVTVNSKQYRTDSRKRMAYCYTDTGIDFVGNTSTGTPVWQKTTYNYNGWNWYLNDSAINLKDGSFQNSNYSFTIRPVICYDNKTDEAYVILYQVLTNLSYETKTGLKFGSHSDVQIEDNDKANIYVRDYGCEMKGNKIALKAHLLDDVYSEVTPVSTYWLGAFGSRTDNIYNDNRKDVTDTDSGMAYSWKDITLAPGESVTKCVYFSLANLSSN